MKGRRNEPRRFADDLARDLGQYIDQSLLVGRIDLKDIDEDNHGVPTWTKKQIDHTSRVDGRRGNCRFPPEQKFRPAVKNRLTTLPTTASAWADLVAPQTRERPTPPRSGCRRRHDRQREGRRSCRRSCRCWFLGAAPGLANSVRALKGEPALRNELTKPRLGLPGRGAHSSGRSGSMDSGVEPDQPGALAHARP